jgi:hypothetical protein
VELILGIFDKVNDWKSQRRDKKISSSLATMKNAKAIKDDRWMAIAFFNDHPDTDVAVTAMLDRFDFSIEHGIQDTKEKEVCMKNILARGAEALPFVTKKLESTTRIAWPIKILSQLGEEEQIIDVLKSALNFGDIDFDQNQVDKNYDILCYLRDYKVPGFAEKLSHFLNDHDERIRFAATEVLLEQEDKNIPSMVEKFLSDSSSENTRIRNSVIEAFVSHNWTIADPSQFSGGLVKEGVFVSKNGQLETRS